MSTARYLSDRYESFLRDVGMIRAGLLGRKPAPFTLREGATAFGAARAAAASPSAAVASLLHPRTVRVRRVVRETADAVSLELEDPTGAPFAFTPGQFLTVLIDLAGAGETVRRAYSISSSALEPSRVTITTKRVTSGRVSNHINDAVREGDLLAVLGPSGAFTVTPSTGTPADPRHLVLFAGGSGITPMMSIVRSVLAVEPNTRVSLVYGNRGIDDIIFREALTELAGLYEGRLTVRHVLQNAAGALEADVGLLERTMVARQLDALAPSAPANAVTEYFICGPEPMMLEVRAALEARGVANRQIHEERFTQPHLRPASGAAAASRAPTGASAARLVTVRMKGRAHEVKVAAGETLLEAGLEAGLSMPFSCAMGGCGACKVTVVSGELEMEEPNCLTQEERDAGCALACIGRPTSTRALVVEVR